MNNSQTRVNYLSLIREKNCTVQVSTNTTKDINDRQAEPAGHLFQIAHDSEMKNQGAEKMNHPETSDRVR